MRSIRTSIRTLSPPSPTKSFKNHSAASTSSTSAWTPGDPIVFAPIDFGTTTDGKSPVSSRRNLVDWVPGDPIVFSTTAVQAGTKRKEGPNNSPSAIRSATTYSRATTTTATHGSPSFSPLSPNTTSDSWRSNRWEPPSPSSRLSTSSTARFSLSRSYALVPSPPPRQPSPTPSELEEARYWEEVEVGSIGAMDEWGFGKIDKGEQAGSPFGQGKKVVREHSREELEQLVQGIDFDDLSDLESEEVSFQSALSSAPGSLGAQQHVLVRTSTPPPPPPRRNSPTNSVHPDVFYSGHRPAAKTATSTSLNRNRPYSSSRMPLPPPLDDFDSDAVADQLFGHLDQGSSKSKVALVERDDSVVVVKKTVIEISSSEGDDDSVEILPSIPRSIAQGPTTFKENLPPPSSSSTDSATPAVVPPRRPISRPLKAASPAPKSKPRPVLSPKPLGPRALLKEKKSFTAEVRAKRDARLKSAFPQFKFEDYQPKPRLVYSFDPKVVEKELAGMVGPVGFDLEWEISKRRGIENKTALAQICDEKTILLVHLSKMRPFPASLKAFIEDHTRIKLGVQIGGDGQKLKRDFGHSPAGLLELNTLARTIDPHHWQTRSYPLIALQELCGIYVEKYLPKDNSVRCGAWEGPLSREQRYYAANDVYSSLQIFLALQRRFPTVPDFSLLSLVSSDPSTASRWSGPIISSTSTSTNTSTAATTTSTSSSSSSTRATPRQLEAYTLWHTNPTHSLTEITRLMNVDRTLEIKSLSVVWNILQVLSKHEEKEFDPTRLVAIVEEAKGPAKERMVEEMKGVLVRARRMMGEVGAGG